MRFLGVVLALAFVVSGIMPTTAHAQNQLQVGKKMTLSARQVSDWWMKVDYDPRDPRRGDPRGGDQLPPGLDRDVAPASALAAPATGNLVNPGNELLVGTRKVGDFQFDVKQQGSKTTGGLPPGIERDTDASSTAAREGIDLLGAERRVRSHKAEEPRKPILNPAIDRASPAAMGAGRSTPRENAVRGVTGYKVNRFE